MPSFLDQETSRNRKAPRESEIYDLLSSGSVTVPFLNIALIQEQCITPNRIQPDGIVEIAWGKVKSRFVFEYKGQNTPKTLSGAIVQITHIASELKLRPLVIVPYLSEDSLADLEARGVSGLDLCGNALILGDRYLVLRTGQPNRYRTSDPIKNIYRGTSSLFARCFLLQNSFSSLAQLHQFALDRSKLPTEPRNTLVKSTASKVVQALVEDLIVAKDHDALRLIDPQRLLSLLRDNYKNPGKRVIYAKTPLTPTECWRRVRNDRDVRSVATGIGSAAYYEVLSIEDVTMLYVSDAEASLTRLEASRTRAFPNIQLVETDSDIPFFDARPERERLWASPIQTWLELATDPGARERDAARILERDLAGGVVGK